VPGCWALNIKYSPEEKTASAIDRFAQIIKAYFMAGGQQVQFNLMTYEDLMKAKENQDDYPELMVRVSGYSAYFKDLNKLMQDELITRTQYDLTTGNAVPIPQNISEKLERGGE
jgi:formate C-acetyltransferase